MTLLVDLAWNPWIRLQCSVQIEYEATIPNKMNVTPAIIVRVFSEILFDTKTPVVIANIVKIICEKIDENKTTNLSKFVVR